MSSTAQIGAEESFCYVTRLAGPDGDFRVEISSSGTDCSRFDFVQLCKLRDHLDSLIDTERSKRLAR